MPLCPFAIKLASLKCSLIYVDHQHRRERERERESEFEKVKIYKSHLMLTTMCGQDSIIPKSTHKQWRLKPKHLLPLSPSRFRKVSLFAYSFISLLSLLNFQTFFLSFFFCFFPTPHVRRHKFTPQRAL